MKTLLISSMLFSSLSAIGDESFRLKLHKVTTENCRVMFFESSDSKEFFLEKFSVVDNRKFAEYSEDPVVFMEKERSRFSYEATLGHASKNHIVSLLEKDIVLKYDYINSEGDLEPLEVVLFPSVSCD